MAILDREFMFTYPLGKKAERDLDDLLDFLDYLDVLEAHDVDSPEVEEYLQERPHLLRAAKSAQATMERVVEKHV